MATIVDANVVIDIVQPGSSWASWAQKRLLEARLEGHAVFNVVIAAEVAHQFASEARYREVFVPALWTFEDIPADAAPVAGRAHREYRRAGGRRERTLPDFLIGAHAMVAGHTLLTRDASRYRSYFPCLPIIAPDTHP